MTDGGSESAPEVENDERGNAALLLLARGNAREGVMWLDTAAADTIEDVEAVVCAQHGHVCAEQHALQHLMHWLMHDSLCTTSYT